MRAGDIWAGGAIAAVGAVSVAVVLPLEFWSEYGPGPAFFPLVLAAVLVVIGGFIAFAGWFDRAGATAAAANYRKPGLVIIVTAAYMALLHVIGFGLATALFLFSLFYWVESRPLGRSLALAVGVTVAVHLIFVSFLKTSLPAGMMASWIS